MRRDPKQSIFNHRVVSKEGTNHQEPRKIVRIRSGFGIKDNKSIMKVIVKREHYVPLVLRIRININNN